MIHWRWWTGKCGKTPARFVLLCLELEGGRLLSPTVRRRACKNEAAAEQQMTSQLPGPTSAQKKAREQTALLGPGGTRT